MARRPQKTDISVDRVEHAETRRRHAEVAGRIAEHESRYSAQLEDVKKQAVDLGAARKALEDAVSITRGLWLSFISLSAYLMVAVGSVTHVDLLLENPLQLPLVGVKVPLVVFFWLAPILYLIMHNYLLINLKLMSDNVRTWRWRLKEILNTEGDLSVDEREIIEDEHKRTISNFFLVQMIAAPKDSRSSLIGKAISVSVIITVLLGPIIILFLFQAQFLPYHSILVTTIQRIVIIFDCIILTYLWPEMIYTHARPDVLSRLITLSAMMAVVFVSTFVAVFPGEANYRLLGQLRSILYRGGLFEGPINDVSGAQSSLFSNRLVLPGKDIANLGSQNSAKTQPSVSLRGRRLEGAILTRSNLQGVDFTGAHLQGADLSQANIKRGKFGCGQLSRVGSYADLEEKLADCANLSEVDLSDANLQGAFFNDAVMQGVNLSGAKMQAASLERADLKGAYLSSTELQGALMNEVQFQGTSISDVNFDGASLRDAVFQGADLRSSNFQGAVLVRTNFIGVVPDIDTKWDNAILDHPNLGKPDSMTSAYFKDFVDETLASIFEGKTKEQVQERLKQLEPASYFSENQFRLKWEQITEVTLPAANNVWEQRWLASRWQDRIDFIIKLVCSEENTPLMAESLVLQSARPDEGGLEVRLLESTGPFRPALARRLLIADRCPGTVGMKTEAQQILRRWADEKPDCELPLPPEQWTAPKSAASDCFQKNLGTN
jgi:uncharacterized protein YjbI with pentapeptide repeats